MLIWQWVKQISSRYHVITARTSYHLLLGRLWIHKHHVVPSTHYKCLKVIWRGKKVHVNASEASFKKYETHILEAAFFDELVE